MIYDPDNNLNQIDTTVPNNDGAPEEEDPFFNAEEIAFQVRRQCHKANKKLVRKLVKTGQIDTSSSASGSMRDKQSVRSSKGFSNF